MIVCSLRLVMCLRLACLIPRDVNYGYVFFVRKHVCMVTEDLKYLNVTILDLYFVTLRSSRLALYKQ